MRADRPRRLARWLDRPLGLGFGVDRLRVDRPIALRGMQLSYAFRGPGDNVEPESFFGRSEVENRSLILDAGSVDDLISVVQDRIGYCYRLRRHSCLGSRPLRAIINDRYQEG